MTVQLRVARPCNDLQAVLGFYRDGLGLTVLGHFEDHDGFDGVMLGQPGQGFHLEFTREHGAVAPRSPSPEHLCVFYLADPAEHTGAVARMKAHGFVPVASHNPYWDRKGVTFEDTEGYRVVLHDGAWPAD